MKKIENIIRIDHSGELGAICIYKAQKFFARLFYPDIVNQLDEMIKNEQKHYSIFGKWLKHNKVRHCHALWIWSLGGYFLGLITALFGRKSIWVCTAAVETKVLEHLHWQLNFLKEHDSKTYQTILSIKDDQKDHQYTGLQYGSDSALYAPIKWFAEYLTKLSMWLSTKL